MNAAYVFWWGFNAGVDRKRHNRTAGELDIFTDYDRTLSNAFRSGWAAAVGLDYRT